MAAAQHTTSVPSIRFALYSLSLSSSVSLFYPMVAQLARHAKVCVCRELVTDVTHVVVIDRDTRTAHTGSSSPCAQCHRTPCNGHLQSCRGGAGAAYLS